MDQHRFHGRVIIVTGAATGLGQASAIGLAQEGADLVLVDQDTATLADSRERLLAASPDARL